MEYNKFMNAVDLADQQLSYHSPTVRKTVKWWKKLFWWFVDMAILNSSIVFCTNHPDKGIRTNREFRLALIEELFYSKIAVMECLLVVEGLILT